MQARTARKQGGKKKPRRKPRTGQTPLVVVNRTIHYMVPRLRTTLRFNTTTSINNVGSIFANKRYQPTGAFDVDPVLGSTAAPGFTELGNIYRQYRVNSYRIVASFSNAEAFPVTVYICAVNFDPTANSASFQTFLSSRECRKKFIGPLTGNGLATLRQSVRTADFTGASNLGVIDVYTSLTNANPANNVFHMIGVVGLANLVSGVDVTVDIDMDIDFFELASPAT